MARTTARAAVMQMIFEHMAGGEGGEETLQMVYEALRKEGLPGVDSISENEPSESDRAYITKVLDGVLAHLDELDEAIQAASPRWEISRMPHVDLTILRMATLYGEGDPGNVARLMRAIDLGRFIWIGNGMNRKSLLHKEDAARASLEVAKTPASGIQV